MMMNVIWGQIIVTVVHHVPIQLEVLIVLVMLGIQEMELIVMVQLC